MSNMPQEIAQAIIRTSQSMLMVRMRYLDAAIFKLTPQEANPNEIKRVATDGETFFYNNEFVLSQYLQDQQSMVRAIMHSLLHCIFIHPFVGKDINRVYWDFAADIAVEILMEDIGFEYNGMKKSTRERIIKELSDELPSITAERVYNYFMQGKYPEKSVPALRYPFMVDEHKYWYDGDGNDKKNSEGQSDSDSGGNGGEDGQPGDSTEEEPNASLEDCDDDESELSEEWQDISKSMQVDLETESKHKGDSAGSMSQALNELHRERYDYSDFLKKFAVLGEAMQINDDEFDYIYYTYGLKLYGNVPLIEPLEYKEVKRIREFVIAIDTSGSTSGPLVQAFLQKTYNILKSTENFFTKINLEIIQCDAQIRESVSVTSEGDFESYIKDMSIKGHGGTDFRPVFNHVDKLIKKGRFTNLKGIIYFTDGLGTFPEKKPDYETAFVFVKNGYWEPQVPSWAIKLVLEEDEVTDNEY